MQEGLEPMYVLGRSRLATPGLSAVSSLKPSTTKSEAGRRAAEMRELDENIRSCTCHPCWFYTMLEKRKEDR